MRLLEVPGFRLLPVGPARCKLGTGSLLCGIVSLFQRHENAVLAELTWRRAVETREIEWVTERSQFRPTVEVRNLRVHREHYTENVPVGGIGLNGMPETRLEYRTREVYEFEVERWLAVFTLGDSGKEHKAKLDEATWRSLEKGASYHLELGIFGHVHSVVPATG